MYTFAKSIIIAVSLSFIPVEAAVGQQVSTIDSTEQPILLARGKKKRRKKRRGRKGRGAKAGKAASAKQFGVKLGAGYLNSFELTKVTDPVQEQGGTATTGFAFALVADLHYYINPNLFVLAEFGYGSIPVEIAFNNEFTNEQVVSNLSIGLTQFGAGAGYAMSFGGGMGASLMAMVGYSLGSVSSDTDESINSTASGLVFGGGLNIFYDVTPSIRVGLEPRLFYSLASETEEEGDGTEPAPTTEEETEETDPFGMGLIALLSVEFMF